MSEPAGLYVHVPFCARKCPYCDFFSVCALDQVPATVDDLRLEAGRYAAEMGPFDTLYIGGGSPSVLTPGQLSGLLSATCGHLSAGIQEITVELNPADVDAELLDALRQAGVNRLSLGVQSFDDGELRFLGRRHDRAGALAAIERIRAAGFAALGLDLIHGLPGRFRESLELALRFRPEHLSCYALTVAPDTPFGQRQRRGDLDLPGDDRNATEYLEACDTLAAAGYDHYEVSNFALTPTLRSRHNQKYWNRTPCLGLGPSAHSFDGTRRWWNFSNLEAYHVALGGDRRPVEGFEVLDPEQARLETLSLGLRTSGGIEASVVLDTDEHEESVERLVREGMLAECQGRLCPTREGFLIADGMARLLS